MEFPRHCHKPNGVFVVVENEVQYDAAIAAGFTDQPETHVEQPVEVRFVDAVSAPTDDAPKKKGKK